MTPTTLARLALPAAAALLFTGAALAQTSADKAKDWCTDAHMQQMQTQVKAMTDSAKQKEAQKHLDESSAAMKKSDQAGCVKHMEEAHKSMGM